LVEVSAGSSGRKAGEVRAALVEADATARSAGVVEMLEKLESKFVDELRNLEKEEMNRKGSHDLLQQSLSDQLETVKKELAD